MKTGAHIIFKAQPSVKIKGWWMNRILKKDIHDIRRFEQGLLSQLNYNHLHFDYVERSNSWLGPKIQLPYNWYVPEEEEVENIDAKSKEKNLVQKVK